MMCCVTVVEEATSEQEQAIARIAARWRASLGETEPIRRDDAEAALAMLYGYMQCDPPRTFLLYESPAAALSDFPRWRASSGRVATTYWRYQLPICDPGSYFRRWLKCGWVAPGAVDLGVRRWPNIHRCFAHAAAIDGLSGGWVASALLDDLWNRILAAVGRGWCDVASKKMPAQFPDVFDALRAAVHQEDPTSQVGELEYVLLGGLDWLVAEAACALVCRDVLGSRMNPDHSTVVTRVADSCGLVLAFERLCVLCERPQAIRTEGGVLTAIFRDGYRVEGAVAP